MVAHGQILVLLRIIVVLLFALAQMVEGGEACPGKEQIIHDEGKLHQDLLCGYHSDFRPVKDHKKSVKVKVRFALKYLTFDELEETFTVHSWVAMTWKDEFLTWTPSDYGGIKEIQMESHEIWTPRMALFNADASIFQSDSFYTTCLVSSDGTVDCVPHVANAGICRTSLRRWPYDEQNCTLYFGSWMHTGEQVNFTFYENQPVVRDDFQNGPGWHLLDVRNIYLAGKYSCCPNSTYPMLKYIFMLRREAAGPAAIVVVPSIVIVILTLVSMLLNVKDNVRLVLICFSLFGHFLFLSEIGYDIPKFNNNTPIILLFIRDSMVVTVIAILMTLLLMSLYRRVGAAPTWMVKVTRLLTSGPGKYVVFTEFDLCDDSDQKGLTQPGIPPEDTKSTNTNIEWKQFVSLLNSCTFVISLLVYFVLICFYIPYD